MKAVKIIENESVALDYLGNAFIKIPRSIIDRLNSVRLLVCIYVCSDCVITLTDM